MYLPLIFVFGQHFRLVYLTNVVCDLLPDFLLYANPPPPFLTLVEIRLIRHDFNENRFPLSRPRIFIEWSGGSTRCRRGGGNQDHDRHTNNNPSQ